MSKITLLLAFLFLLAPVRGDYVPPAFKVLQVKTAVDLQEQTLDEFVTWMRDHVGWSVVVRWEPLSLVGITRDTPVSIQLEEVPVHVIVNEVFQQVSEDITYHLTRHAMIISSRDDFNKHLYTRVYDLTDLVMILTTSEEKPPAMDLRSMSTEKNVSTSFFGETIQEDDEDKKSAEEVKLSIEKAIMNIKPDTWRDSGGKGSISWLGNTIIIRNSIEVHDLIAGVFYL